ncbi:MAG: hypothetical protein IT446_00440, partial [Phycisphaerales bacterium]|nr:hypothetical protein [Phycisphaerales bacterium]
MKIALLLVTMIALAADAAPGPLMSSLSEQQRQQFTKMTMPPPAKERHGPYSTPMYYLMHKGYEYNGSLDEGPTGRTYIQNKPGPDYGCWALDRNRPDWQEAMIKDWVELGLNNTHLNIYPLEDKYDLPADYLKAIRDFAHLSEQYGLKVGVRLDPPGGYVAWDVNPDNPDNHLKEYLQWTRTLAELLKGKTAYWVLGDELTLHEKSEKDLPEKAWTTEGYLNYFKQVSTAIKQIDPDAKVSMFAAESGKWDVVLNLLKHGYAEYGDAVAINYYNYTDVPRFFDDARKLAPKLMFLSNGVGYCSNGLVEPRYPEGDPYSRVSSEEEHGDTIAKNMFAWWDLGASTAPYYISLRNWVKDGKVYPRWFGFFGFEDYIIENDQLSVKRYPGWYALRTIAHTFYNRDQFRTPGFAVKSSADLTMFKAYEHKLAGGSELLLMLWNDSGNQ